MNYRATVLKKFENVLMQVRRLNREKKKMEKDFLAALAKKDQQQTSLTKRSRQIQELISKGATTGDRFSDVCIAAYGVFGTAKMAWELRELDRNIAQKKGQLVFVVRRREELASIHSNPGNRTGARVSYRTKAECFLGILPADTPSLSLMKETFSLPIAVGIWLHDGVPSPLPLELKLYSLTNDITTNVSGTRRALEIVVGDEEVVQYIRGSMSGFESKFFELAKVLRA